MPPARRAVSAPGLDLAEAAGPAPAAGDRDLEGDRGPAAVGARDGRDERARGRAATSRAGSRRPNVPSRRWTASCSTALAPETRTGSSSSRASGGIVDALQAHALRVAVEALARAAAIGTSLKSSRQPGSRGSTCAPTPSSCELERLPEPLGLDPHHRRVVGARLRARARGEPADVGRGPVGGLVERALLQRARVPERERPRRPRDRHHRDRRGGPPRLAGERDEREIGPDRQPLGRPGESAQQRRDDAQREQPARQRGRARARARARGRRSRRPPASRASTCPRDAACQTSAPSATRQPASSATRTPLRLPAGEHPGDDRASPRPRGRAR